MKRNELFEKCTSNVNPETRAEVERNMALSEEFWKEWSDAEIPAPIDAILWGMRKQKQIDIAERKRLKETPITEEWLKEHGFVVSDEIHSKRDKIYIYPEHGVKVYLDVDCSEGVVGNADCIDINGSSNQFHKENYGGGKEISLSDLYDSCELCGIELK